MISRRHTPVPVRGISFGSAMVLDSKRMIVKEDDDHHNRIKHAKCVLVTAVDCFYVTNFVLFFTCGIET